MSKVSTAKIKLVIGKDGYSSVFVNGKIKCFLPTQKAKAIYRKLKAKTSK